MPNLEFHEENEMIGKRASKKNALTFFEKLIIKTGIVKSKEAAQKVLLLILVVAVILTIVINVIRISNENQIDEKYYLDPDEQLYDDVSGT
jgi:hypothetical protein